MQLWSQHEGTSLVSMFTWTTFSLHESLIETMIAMTASNIFIVAQERRRTLSLSQMLDTHTHKTSDRPNVKTSAFPLSTHASHLSALSALITNVPPWSIFGSVPVGVHAALELLIRCQMWVRCQWSPVHFLPHPAVSLYHTSQIAKEEYGARSLLRSAQV